MLTTPSSAATVLPLRKFAVASKTWLKRTQTHPLLTDGPKRFCTALYLNFNYKHYLATGELLAWPSWDRLEAEYGLCRTTINESTDRLEQFQLLDVEHGQWDRAAQRRKGNRYRARFPAANVHDQGAPNAPDQGAPDAQYLLDSPFLQRESRLGEGRLDSERETQARSLPRQKVTEEELKASLERLAATKRRRP